MAKVRRVGLDEIIGYFDDLEYPRDTVNRKHPLVSVVVIALMAVLSGAGGPTAIARWAALKADHRAIAVGPAAPLRTANRAMTTTLTKGCLRLTVSRGSSKSSK